MNHRGHRVINKFSLCSPKEYPLADITGRIISCCIEVHSKLGPGLLESIYEEALAYLKAMDKRVGLLINFNVLRVKEGIKRLIL